MVARNARVPTVAKVVRSGRGGAIKGLQVADHELGLVRVVRRRHRFGGKVLLQVFMSLED